MPYKNSDKRKQKEKEWRIKNADKVLHCRLMYTYNLPLSEFNIMLEKQKNCCAMCSKPFTKTPYVDHCHITGKVRGLLCNSCNIHLGHYEKHKDRCIKYLKENK